MSIETSNRPHSALSTQHSALAYLKRLRQVDWRVSGTLLAWFVGLWLLMWAVIAISGITPDYIGNPTAAQFNQERAPLWLYVWTRWDGQWYLNLAWGGYGTIPYDSPFFPMYPMLAAGVRTLTMLPVAAAGIIVSYASLALALVYFYKLVRLDFGHGTAVRAIVTLVLYPTAFFLLAMYTESLVLFLTCAALYYARMGRWWLVAPIMLMAGLTKISALALVLALMSEALLGEANSPEVREGKGWRALLRPRLLLSRLTPAKFVALLAAPAGLLGYIAFQAWRYGDPFSFIHAQPIRFWRGRFSFFEQEWRLISSWFNRGMSISDWSKLGDFVAALLLLAMTVYVARTMRLSYAALIVGFIVLLALSAEVLSLNRYILTIAPVFIGIAILAKRKPVVWGVWLGVSALLQIYFATLFFLWEWVA